jgi:pimeloyl-ACP methyl ester carboxylesterase
VNIVYDSKFLIVRILFLFVFSRFRTIESLKKLSWNNTGPEQLVRAEMKIFETLKSQFQGRHIPILNNTQKIWTIYSNLTSKNFPLVLIHGFGGGVGLWSLALDQLCLDRPVYALDLPGFAHSSRPIFSSNPIEAEQQFVDMLEEWRIGIGLNEQFILLGHSFGGFISAAYAIRHPEYIKQLVLIDPWGFGRKPDDWQTSRMQRIPPWLRSFSNMLMKISPLAGLRMAGPFGKRKNCFYFIFIFILFN